MNEKMGYDKYEAGERSLFGAVISGDEVEHVVEDARTKRTENETPSLKAKTGKKPSKGEKKIGAALVICITLLCFCTTVFAADLISGSATLASYAGLLKRNKDKESYESFYMVYATHDEDMGVSYKNAGAVRKEGGAGYVMKIGEEYYVILNAYERKHDAEIVAKKQANYGVYELKLYSFDAAEAKDLKGAEAGEGIYKEVFRAMYDGAAGLQKGVLNTVDVKTELQELKERVGAMEESFSDAADPASVAALDYRVLLRTMKSSMENVISSESDLVPLLRYYGACVLHSQALFREKYFK